MKRVDILQSNYLLWKDRFEIVGSDWVTAHWNELSQNYRYARELWRRSNHGVTIFDFLNKCCKYVHRYIGYLHS